MKTTIYTINQKDITAMLADYKTALAASRAAYHKQPEHYGGKTSKELEPVWRNLACNLAKFHQLRRDGLARIDKVEDEFTTFEDISGDSYNPEVNNNIEPALLKSQEIAALRRFNKQGAFGYILSVEDKELSSIWGFVGNDFYGSGYDSEYYCEAIEQITKTRPEYVSQFPLLIEQG